MQSAAKTVEEYLAELPDDRRTAIEAVRQTIKKNLPKGVEEGMGYGMIVYYIPHSIYPPGYHCDPKIPLGYVALASQKNYMSVYLYSIYGENGEEARFIEAYKATGKKPDVGKCCVRFKKLEDLPLDLIGSEVAKGDLNYLMAMNDAMIAKKRAQKRKK